MPRSGFSLASHAGIERNCGFATRTRQPTREAAFAVGHANNRCALKNEVPRWGNNTSYKTAARRGSDDGVAAELYPDSCGSRSRANRRVRPGSPASINWRQLCRLTDKIGKAVQRIGKAAVLKIGSARQEFVGSIIIKPDNATAGHSRTQRFIAGRRIVGADCPCPYDIAATQPTNPAQEAVKWVAQILGQR